MIIRALQRSFSTAQVCEKPLAPDAPTGAIAVYIRPGPEALGPMQHVAARGGKVLVFGAPAPDILPLLGLEAVAAVSLEGLDAAEMCFTEHHHASPGLVRYTEHPLALASPLRQRFFRRYDYAEWNNLGYGAITTDGSAFAADGGIAPREAVELAGILRQERRQPPRYLGPYITLHDRSRGSLLWCARPVGPLDSVEWQVVERFICDWRPDLCCLPCLLQTPKGCACLVTMRLDCDEDIRSARPLFDWYLSRGVPFSLAVKTGLDMGPEDVALLEAVRESGGTLLSHSRTHPLCWGADVAQALEEARSSREWFGQQWPDQPLPRLAVSPFHTNPPYAVQALAQAGYAGFVGGIIHSDPECNLGRAGLVPFAEGIVSISQQSMLHGDSFRNQGEGVAVHVEACNAQKMARGIFGYLDHPFSQRYQYGWDSEQQRIQAHALLLDAVGCEESVWFWNQQQCFDFVSALAESALRLEDDTVSGQSSREDVEYRLRGKTTLLRPGS
ncbi:MAG: hypothetical protein CXZ00_16610 [Acidobacteria bacterium]|nr:MAG: hypothetical protein CXZ00_16610 [Acidobacteriota bacterium]